MSDTTAPIDTPSDPITAASPPVGVSSTQIFAVAMSLMAIYAIAGAAVLLGGDAAERTAYLQSVIGLAGIAVGYYLGSSASSRNREGVR